MTFHAERYPKDWKAIRARILARAGNACEQCRAPNGVTIVRGEDAAALGTYMLEDGVVHDEDTGAVLGRARGSEYEGRWVKVVLTIAHLDHDESNNDESNLRALCQLHHLRHDAADNARRRRANAQRRKAEGMLPGLGGAR